MGVGVRSPLSRWREGSPRGRDSGGRFSADFLAAPFRHLSHGGGWEGNSMGGRHGLASACRREFGILRGPGREGTGPRLSPG